MHRLFNTTNNYDLGSCGGFLPSELALLERSLLCFSFSIMDVLKEGYPNGFAQTMMRLGGEGGHYYLQAFTWSRSYKDLSASTRVKPMFKQHKQESVVWFIQGAT